ncbi:VanZ family protein [Paenibacillus sp. N3/727]|uniref:VanZ family protein n=1 Tax=Paenibacillus sp. N3/727 TaxID=2925845 RepID=UPI001F533D16|nr:VanZ family protein [Paenibacillus sp. N3/727]UNK21156.1 VanZ family protein [Paenibacillus sp. N3/727]
MLDYYLFPISYAFLTFPIAAMLCAIPILVLQYRKHGYFNKFRGVLLYLFLLYLMNALYLVILPMPASRHNAPMSSYAQLIPFNFIRDILAETRVVWSDPSTYVRLIKERAFLQVVFNIALVVPFGMFMRYYLRKSWLTCLVASLGLSLFFEVTQVTGIYGFYDYPYRLFDVDDLFLNTLGGMIGFVMARWASSHLPRLDRLDAEVDLSQKRVSYTRRSIAFMMDWIVMVPVLLLLNVLNVPLAYFLATSVYFILIPYLNGGRTLGKSFVRIRITGAGGHLRLREIAIRYGLLYLVFGGVHVLYTSLYFPGILRPMYFVGLFLMDACVFVHVLVCLFGRKQRLLHEQKSGTDHAIT